MKKWPAVVHIRLADGFFFIQRLLSFCRGSTIKKNFCATWWDCLATWLKLTTCDIIWWIQNSFVFLSMYADRLTKFINDKLLHFRVRKLHTQHVICACEFWMILTNAFQPLQVVYMNLLCWHPLLGRLMCFFLHLPISFCSHFFSVASSQYLTCERLRQPF